MKAMIFAAGLGTRLRPLTDNRPKALVEVAGRAALSRVIDHLKEAGTDSFVVNVHHFAGQVIDFLKVNYPDLRITVADESAELLDTGGGLLNAAPYFAVEPFFIVHNADIVTDVDIRAMVQQHVETGSDVTLLTSRRQSTRHLMADSEGRICGWENTLTGAKLPEHADFGGCSPVAFGGVHVINGSVLSYLADYASGRKVFPIVSFYAASASFLNIRAFMPDSEYLWHDIGSPEKLRAAETALYNQQTINKISQISVTNG